MSGAAKKLEGGKREIAILKFFISLVTEEEYCCKMIYMEKMNS